MYPRLHFIEIFLGECDKISQVRLKENCSSYERAIFFKEEIKGEENAFPFVQTNKDQET